jgi:hypothetical protein
MMNSRWPDPLQPASAADVATYLQDFWHELAPLADLLNRQEYLLAEQQISRLRQLVLNMMLALNGIKRPAQTRHLNTYLSSSQRAALQKTLIVPNERSESWLGCAVALVVIYRWYAPQLVQRFEVAYPRALETATLAQLQSNLADWPLSITTDDVTIDDTLPEKNAG